MKSLDIATLKGALAAHTARLSQTNLRALFAGDETRFDRFSWRLDDLLIDMSKEKICLLYTSPSPRD